MALDLRDFGYAGFGRHVDARLLCNGVDCSIDVQFS
jgi:hypothetical protein